MAHPEKTPAVQKALHKLRAQIRHCRENDRARLPSTSELARVFMTSKASISKALAILKNEGTVRCYRGSGIFIQGTHHADSAAKLYTPATAKPPHLSSAIRIKSAIEKHILSGSWPAAKALPSIKELQHAYGTSYRTMKKILVSLCRDGAVEPHGAGYRVALPGTTSSSAKIVLVWPYEKLTENLNIVEIFYDSILRKLEEECARVNISLDVIYDRYRDHTVSFVNLRNNQAYDVQEQGNVLGYIFLLRLFADAHEKQLACLSHTKKPIAILDVTGQLQLKSISKGRPLLRIFTMSVASQAGAKVARYLLSLGHRDVAYISPFHHYVWSRMRFQALCDTYSKAGLRKGAHLHALEKYGSRNELFQAIKARIKLPELTGAYHAWKKEIPYEYRSQLDPVMGWTTYDIIIRGGIYELLLPIMTRALHNTSSTAWIGANDVVAAIAFDFLSRNGVRIPEDISLIGFDDSLEALKLRLTSYNFNLPGLSHAMLQHIIQPESICRFQKSRIIDIDGTLVVRDSTQKLR
ncbi:MAG: GntR family transcriptional regulator [Chitinivibrionales bacterium]|nr:GntR family transcriptional regulator [Chitinivibrionales bacterium]